MLRRTVEHTLTTKMKLFSVFAFVAVASALDYDSIGLKKPNKGQSAAAPVDKVMLVININLLIFFNSWKHVKTIFSCV